MSLSAVVLRILRNLEEKPPGTGRLTADGNGMDIYRYGKNAAIPFLASKVRRSERGASLVEYALLVALIAVVCIVAVSFIGTSAKANFNKVGSSIASP
jgi:pilus assembly protein Flp/PilA